MNAFRSLALLAPPVSFLAVFGLKLWLALQYQILEWDSYAYLSNARVFLLGPAPNIYFELVRPPLVPFLIALEWGLTGQSTAVATIVQPIFTVATALILFRMGTEMFNRVVGLFAAFLFLLTPIVFVWTNEILVHGVMTFFVTTTVYFLWKATSGRPNVTKYYVLVGVSAALAALARYTALLMVPISIAYVAVTLFIRLRQKSRLTIRNEVAWMILAAAVFLMIWLPWLVWNYGYTGGNFLASVIAGSRSVGETCVGTTLGCSEAQSWGFYVLNAWKLFDSHLLTIPMVIFVVPALVVVLRKPWKEVWLDRRVQLIGIWLIAFFLFYSSIPNQEVRFYVDWFMPVALVTGFGFAKLLSFLGRYPHACRIVGVFGIIWLFGLSYVAVQSSYQDISVNTDGYLQNGFFETVNWAHANMNTTDLGATDLPTMFSYLSDRNFLGIEAGHGIASVVLSIPESEGIPVGVYLAQTGVKFVIVSSEFARNNNLDGNSSALRLIKSIGDFRIYVPIPK